MTVLAAATKTLLIVLSLTSFVPQLLLIRTRQDTAGISLNYVLFNLVVATEQLGLFIHVIAFQYHGILPGMVDDPPSFGDWLNLAQFAVVWLGHVTLLLNVVSLPPQRSGHKTAAVLVYLAFLAISIGPLVIEATLPTIEATLPTPNPDTTPENDRTWIAALYWGGHTLYINPIITFLGLLSLLAQAHATLFRITLGALSLPGLGWQAIIFTVVGISWTLRMTLPTRSSRVFCNMV